MHKRSITVVGAGITGLWQALTLAHRGYRVRLVEQSAEPFTRAASSYAGAMLGPYCETEAAAPVIRAVDAQWAREVVDHCVATLLIQASRHLADNEIERSHKRVMEFIRAAGSKGIGQNELTRRTQFIEPRLRREILLTLIESEQVSTMVLQQRGRPKTIYRLADPASPTVSSNFIASSIDANQLVTQ